MSAKKSLSNPKLRRTVGKKSTTSKSKKSHDKADSPLEKIHTLSLTELQRRAKKYGIPFGGLHKSEIVDKIRKYVKKSV